MDENEVESQYFQNIKKDQPVMGVTLLQFAGGPKLREKIGLLVVGSESCRFWCSKSASTVWSDDSRDWHISLDGS